MMKGGDVFLKEAQFLGSGLPDPFPHVGSLTPLPPMANSSVQLVSQNVCTDPKASCQDMWIYPELPSMLCFKLSDICDSFSMSRCFPAKNQMSCCPTIMDKSLTRMRLIQSQISQALPYSRILVKLCPVLVLPNKLV